MSKSLSMVVQKLVRKKTLTGYLFIVIETTKHNPLRIITKDENNKLRKENEN